MRSALLGSAARWINPAVGSKGKYNYYRYVDIEALAERSPEIGKCEMRWARLSQRDGRIGEHR